MSEEEIPDEVVGFGCTAILVVFLFSLLAYYGMRDFRVLQTATREAPNKPEIPEPISYSVTQADGSVISVEAHNCFQDQFYRGMIECRIYRDAVYENFQGNAHWYWVCGPTVYRGQAYSYIQTSGQQPVLDGETFCISR